MNCPACGGRKIKTRDVRSYHDPNKNFYYVERRRLCLTCDHKFKTIELDIEDYENLLRETEGVQIT